MKLSTVVLILLLSFVCMAQSWAAVESISSPMNGRAYFYDGAHLKCHHFNVVNEEQSAQWLAQGWYEQAVYELQEYREHCIRIPVNIESTITQPIMLVASFLASAQLYWDGEIIAEKGIPGSDFAQEVSGPLTVRPILHRDQLTPGQHWLSLHVSSFGHREDLHQLVYLLNFYDVDSALKDKNQQLITLLLIGAMFLLWVVFLLIYWRYQKSPVYSLFAWLCFMAGALLALELMKYFWNYPWTFHIIRLRIIIPTVLITALLLVAYYLTLFEFKRKARCLWSSAIAFAVVAIFAPSYDFKSLLIFFMALLLSVLIAAMAWRRRLAGASVHTGLLSAGIVALFVLPFQFIDQWFAALFSLIALANLYTMSGVFGRDRTRALRSIALEAELLRRNLQPHFLMNSLTLLSEWIETEPAKAVTMIEQLADEFRLLNQMSKQDLVAWDDELKLCCLHIDIMKARYQRAIVFDVQSSFDNFKIPPAIIHSVVENVFAHNRLQDGDCIVLKVQTKDDTVKIECRSPLRSHSQQREGTGTGNDYIKSRLQQSFANEWKLISQAQGGLWLVQIQFPYRPVAAQSVLGQH